MLKKEQINFVIRFFCPVLGLADNGDTTEEAISNMEKLIKFHLECLAEEGELIPIERPEKGLMRTIQVFCPKLAGIR
ncbi:hypothetical protein CVV26_01540 [Candidatus Kuenenbacteria bacterium HGW-Kuenenbacteria-1]|uniref:HicB-like antitoxin of toxin-antitoxin system domain-containing protein n=1 Tax=Candidatus Kuenenbacteria bacterium HGW-Kuenenbacteria-1 TaxID=2013812 RepID=A0A2N1UNL0_9BACT|nr:MAG: hypothetical protein CVV26_01540 [Candidatus Kuenenbacteria bacterium HGW-Kuenenbacteria-1]